MSHVSFYSILKNIDPLQKAKKAQGQFIEIPEWMKIAKNSKDPLTSSQRSQAKRILSGANKIAPEDMKAIINTRNLDLMTMLADKPDLTLDTMRAILDHNTRFDGTNHRFAPGNTAAVDAEIASGGINNRDREKSLQTGFEAGRYREDTRAKKKKHEVYDTLIGKLRSHGDEAFHAFLKNGSEDAVNYLARGNKLTSQDMFHIVTERPLISSSTMENMANKTDFGNEHLVELMNRPESHLKQTAVANMRGSVSPQIVGAAFRSNDPEFLRGLLDNSKINLTTPQWKQVLTHPDDKLRNKAHGSFADLDEREIPADHMDEVKALRDHIIQNSKAPDVKNFLYHYKRYNYRNQPDLEPNQMAALVNRLEREPAIFDENISDVGPMSSEQKNIAVHSVINGLTPEDQKHYYGGDKSGFISKILNGDETGGITPETLTKLLSTDKMFQSNLWDRVLDHQNVSPEHIQQIYNVATTNSESDRNNRDAGIITRIASHEKTPSELIMRMAGQGVENLPFAVKKGFVSGNKLPRDAWEKLAFGEDAEMRINASSSDHVTPDDISRGLADPDKNVRASWIKTKHPLTQNHWDAIKTDRSAINRATAIGRADMPADVLTHFLTKDKALGVNRAAIGHANVTPEALDAAVSSLNPHNLAVIGGGLRLSEDQNKSLYKRLVEDRVTKLAKLNKQAKDGKITPEDLTSGIAKIDHAHRLSMKEMSHHSQLGSDVVHGIVSGARTNDLEWATNKLRSNNLMKPEHWDALLDRQDLPASLVRTVAETAAPSPERWKTIADKLDPAKYDSERVWHDIIAKNPSVPDEVVDRFIDHGHKDFLHRFLNDRPENTVKPEQIKKIYNKLTEGDHYLSNEGGRKLDLLNKLAEHEALPSDLIEPFYDKMLANHGHPRHSYGLTNIRRELLKNANTPMSIITKGIRDPHPEVASVAQEKMGEHDPDAVNAALNGHEIDVHPAIEKLKHFKGLVQELGNGEPIPKGKLPNKGQGMPNEVFDAKGQVSPKSVDEFIDKLPKDKYNITYTNWNGAQRHDRNKNQLVMQVNLTNKLVGDLKEQGLWPLFQKIHNSSYRSGHPVRKHSLGWARLDMSHPEHAHIDEIQSDLGQGSIRQIEEYASKGRMDKAQAEEMVGGIKKIIKTLSGQFKNINQVISAAVHHTFRLHPEQLKSPEGETLAPIKGVSYDMPKDQAKQSSMHTDVNVNHDTLKNFYDGDLNPDDYTHRAISAWAKSNGVEGNPEIGLEKFKEQHGAVGKLDVPVPGFMKETYQQMPEAMGYKPEEKAKVMPDSQSGYGETQVQYRKLTKSLTKLRNLANMLRELQEKK